MVTPVTFPGLFGDFSIAIDPIAIHVGHGIYWYGIILAAGMLAGLYLCMKQAPRFGLTASNVEDMVLWAVPCCIIGSRVYYVLFNLDFYRNADGALEWGRMVAIWDGGLAIYGTVIAGFLVALIFTRAKKIRFGAMTDLGVMGLLLGQVIGRWANFVNQEAFGGVTDMPWRMCSEKIADTLYQNGLIDPNAYWSILDGTMGVHPTFFYESLWNLIGLLLIIFVVTKGRRFDGENTWFYFLWYGIGRFWVEGLRTDSLYLFDWEFLGAPIRVSQALSLLMAIVAAVMLVYHIGIRKCSPESLLVNQKAAEAQRAEALASEDATIVAATMAEPVAEEAPATAEEPAEEAVEPAEAPAEEPAEAPAESAEEVPAAEEPTVAPEEPADPT